MAMILASMTRMNKPFVVWFSCDVIMLEITEEPSINIKPTYRLRKGIYMRAQTRNQWYRIYPSGASMSRVRHSRHRDFLDNLVEEAKRRNANEDK